MNPANGPNPFSAYVKIPSNSGSLFNRLFNESDNIKIPTPTMTQPINAGPGADALAKSDVNPKTPPPIEELITSATSAIKLIFLTVFFSSIIQLPTFFIKNKRETNLKSCSRLVPLMTAYFSQRHFPVKFLSPLKTNYLDVIKHVE